MHRHGYKGRKLGREKDQRRALLKSLASSLIDNGAITTTVPKAKEIVPYVEKLITKAKKGDLHSRRQIMAKVAHVSSAHKLVDEIAPKLTTRTSGHIRITKDMPARRGDNAPMARVSFVDELNVAPVANKSAASTTNKAKSVKEPTKENAKQKKVSTPTAQSAKNSKPSASTAKSQTKRTGIRGNK